MRCITLADALKAKGAKCQFICRAHEGNLIEFIRSKGYIVHALPGGAVANQILETPCIATSDFDGPSLAHSQWLGATQAQDAEACAAILAKNHADWLIVDHYALDIRWERVLEPHYRHLMVVDDLADRSHACDLLLDQTLGRDEADYLPLVPNSCRLLCGSRYALLRPEFAALRSYSLQRRTRPALRELLITMGGVDKDNVTTKVLQALSSCQLPDDCRITVVMGATAPWLNDVRKQAENMAWHTRVLVGVSNMAHLMADSDLAIGAAGATSWERCCLGLPSVVVVIAKNQRSAASALLKADAALVIDYARDGFSEIRAIIKKIKDQKARTKMACQASSLVDGFGVTSVADILVAFPIYDV